jgi:putative phosphoribosyl transferase
MAEIEIPIDGEVIRGDLAVPLHRTAVVAFAHGSGSSRHSPRNRQVAHRLQQDSLATVLVDLLTEEEEAADLRSGHFRFDVNLLAGRLLATSGWLETRPEIAGLPVGYFGASTGAAAALVAAAADTEQRVGAVVSRGGRPDLAGDALDRVRAPTLLIVGSRDELVLDLNRRAARRLSGEHRLEVVRGATHLFDEPGTLEQVGELAAGWFVRWLG